MSLLSVTGLLEPPDLIKICCLLCVQRDILVIAFRKKGKKKLALMSSFSFWMTLFSPLPHLPPSFPFGHIAYKSQAILVSGLQKAWPPGKACRTAVTCLIRPLLNSSLCICVCALELFFFFSFPHSSIHALIRSLLLYAPAPHRSRYAVHFFHRMLAVASVDLPTNHLAFLPHQLTF